MTAPTEFQRHLRHHHVTIYPRPSRCPHPSSTTKFDCDGAAGCDIGLRDASRECSCWR